MVSALLHQLGDAADTMTVPRLARMIGRIQGRSRPLLPIFAAVFATACASTGATPRPFPMPGARVPPRIAEASPPPVEAAGTGETSSVGLPGRAGGTGSARGDTGGAGGTGSAGLQSCASCIDAYALTGTALSLRGTRYRDGGTDPAGFDCSGFTQYVFGQHGIALPREVKDQFGTGKLVEPAEIAPGDLIFFSTVAPGASHVAIALGGDEFVHAPSSTGVVRVEHLASPYWSQRFIGARRIN